MKPTIILEAVASSDLWHAFFGLPGSLNDINVLHRSPVFDDLALGNAPQVSYTVNGKHYNIDYYLADGIYPEWATLITDIVGLKHASKNCLLASTMNIGNMWNGPFVSSRQNMPFARVLQDYGVKEN
jgi:hypothetical protein